MTQSAQDKKQMSMEVDELKAQRRRDRRRIRELENRRAIENDRARGDLPVEVRGPEPAVPPENESMVQGETYSEDGVIAYQDDDLEVVYVGEAAEDTSVRPSIKLYESGSSTPRAVSVPPRTAARRAPAAPRVADPIRPPSERLAVTKRVPSVASADRLKTAPPAPALGATGATGATGAKAQKAVAVPAAEAPDSDDPRALYKRYYKALRAGNHQFAIVGFRAFLARFPAHDLADNAQYWLGEAFYDQKKYDEALAEFARVPKQFPKGNKVGDAALKHGYCLLALGRIEEGRAALDRVIDQHPDTNAARLAADRLHQLDDSHRKKDK